jgi:molybdopterin-guanine dinucleotide biosynthesis protein MobB
MGRHQFTVPLVGFAAWSGTGKTTLLRQLIPVLRTQGISIGIIKHAHHEFDIDYPGKDSYELRKSGAEQTLIASTQRRALIVEHEEARELGLDELLECLDRSRLDVVLVEGFRHLPFPKIELYRSALGRPLMHPQDPNIVAIATDEALETRIPRLDLNDPAEIAKFVVREIISE